MQNPTPYDTTIASLRAEFEAALALVERCGAIIRLLPESSLPGVCLSCGDLMLYNLTREHALEVMQSLSAGRWEKRICPGHTTRVDYTATIDGITVRIYGAEAPPTCRIVEEEVDVPAHKEIKRTLVCH